MKKKELYLYITLTALVGAIALAVMLAISIFNGGITAQHFEVFADPQTYSSELLANEGSLRAILTSDSIFLAFYTAAVLFVALAVKNEDNAWLIGVSVAALVLTTFLDIHENQELLTFVQMANLNVAPTVEMLQARALWSAIKFNASYLSFFLLAFALPDKTTTEKFLRISLWVGFLPIGVLVYTFPNPLFALGRYLLMLAGLLILSWNYYQRWLSK
jgi:hypothetical protein